MSLNNPYRNWSLANFNGEEENAKASNETPDNKKKKLSPANAKASVVGLLEQCGGESVKEIMIKFINACDVLRVKDLKQLEADLKKAREEERLRKKFDNGKQSNATVTENRNRDDPLSLIASQEDDQNSVVQGKE